MDISRGMNWGFQLSIPPFSSGEGKDYSLLSTACDTSSSSSSLWDWKKPMSLRSIISWIPSGSHLLGVQADKRGQAMSSLGPGKSLLSLHSLRVWSSTPLSFLEPLWYVQSYFVEKLCFLMELASWLGSQSLSLTPQVLFHIHFHNPLNTFLTYNDFIWWLHVLHS